MMYYDISQAHKRRRISNSGQHDYHRIETVCAGWDADHAGPV